MPKSMVQKERDITWYQHARNYVEMKWDHSPATTRRNLAEAMATVPLALVKDTKGMPDHRAVRQTLYSWAFNVKRWTEDAPADVLLDTAEDVALYRKLWQLLCEAAVFEHQAHRLIVRARAQLQTA
ncbi:hypothetical protein [Streptomyces sp. NPDC002889]|uniref:hypothetical protein n=1 Tax=Streptomyces sp. NPDC002889 TaxID=3364669 RepID=UPI00369CA740